MSIKNLILSLLSCLNNYMHYNYKNKDILKVNEQEVFDILTGKISSSINRTLLRSFAQKNVNLTTEQWSVMSCLWKQDKITQQQLCTFTQKDKPSMTRLIDNLEKNKLVVRVPHSTDRRINLIHLTRQGSAMQEQASALVESVVDKALMDISDEDVAVARKVLNKIINNLE